MFCPKCGKEVDPQTQTCPQCGDVNQSQAPPPVQGPPLMPAPMQQAPPQYNATNKNGTISMVLGIASMILWCLPILGLPASIIGLVLGIKAQRENPSGAALTGIVLSSIGLVASIVNAGVGAYMGATGKLFPPVGH